MVIRDEQGLFHPVLVRTLRTSWGRRTQVTCACLSSPWSSLFLVQLSEIKKVALLPFWVTFPLGSGFSFLFSLILTSAYAPQNCNINNLVLAEFQKINAPAKRKTRKKKKTFFQICSPMEKRSVGTTDVLGTNLRLTARPLPIFSHCGPNQIRYLNLEEVKNLFL